MTELVNVEVQLRKVADGLHFPEGPVALNDGSVVLVEIPRGTLSRVDVASGEISVVAECGGGPNGAAIGPDGKAYICNNGGYFTWFTDNGVTIPGPRDDAHQGGSIQRVDLDTGEVDELYTHCDGRRLVAPNDLVFDDQGGFWFTDHGVQHDGFPDHPGLLYARADGSSVEGRVWGTDSTNGVGLSPDGTTVYAAETHSGTLWSWPLTGPGALAAGPEVAGADHGGGTLVFDGPAGNLFDSLAVDGDGWVCVATIGNGGITCVAPDGTAAEHLAVPDPLVTNICFAGPGHGSDDYRIAYITASSSGVLYEAIWPRAGLRLAYEHLG